MTAARRLAAILAADVVGFSRLAGAVRARTLSRLRGLRSDLIDPAVAAPDGRIVKRAGDGSPIEPPDRKSALLDARRGFRLAPTS